MDRRRFLLTALAGALAAPLRAGQQEAHAARIAVVCAVQCEGREHDAFRAQLRELGRIEGRGLVIDVRGAQGRPDRLPALIAELPGREAGHFRRRHAQPARAAREATSTVPIVLV